MITLIIDAAQDKVFFKIINDNKSYTNEFSNSRENFDKFTGLLFNFLKKNNINVNKINNILINQGPGKSSSIRTSISVAKALSVTSKLNLYGFKSNQIIMILMCFPLGVSWKIINLRGWANDFIQK